MKIRTKLGVMAAGSLVALIAVAAVLLIDQRSSLLHERQLKTRHVVETAHNVVAHFHALAKGGAMTDEQARAAAIQAVKALRYDEKEYFWINDLGPSMIMHPYKPELDGKDLTDFKDPDGKRLFVEFVNTVKARGAGFVFYLWPKPGLSEPVAKVSYVRGFTPWEWVIGSGIYIDDVDAAFWRRVRLALIVIGVLAVVFGLGVWRVSRSITRRMHSTVGALQALAAGDLSRSVEDRARDELGLMGAALNGATGALNAVVGELGVMIAASREGRLEVRGDAARYNGAYAELVVGTNSVLDNLAQPLRVMADTSDAIASSSTELTSVSRELGSNAAGTLSQMLVVSDAARQVSRTTQALATSTDEMAATIKEIAANAANSARVAGQAVHAAERTNTVINKLGGSAAQIGNVVKVITAIAQQTNLLALNATIEAARAGEAGKGFAVVANEVKELAKETAKATGDIELSVQSIQTDTEEAVAAIASIGSVISQISDMASAIATAVEQQSATTNEMGRNVSEAAKGAGDIANNIGSVSEVAQSTATGAGQALNAATGLARMAAELKQHVSTFTFERR
jgi:methyl-accepting chemotaxis protein